MRYAAALLLALALAAPAAARADGPAPRPAQAKGKLVVTIDRAKVDLPGRKLEVTLNHPADKVRLKVLSESGAVLAEVEKAFPGAAAGAPLAVTWTPSSDEAVARIEVWGHDTDGFYAGVAITPWAVQIPHEEVNFETNSDVIRATEAPKLEASLALVLAAVTKHKDLGTITLFIAGHTDTVGSPASNLALSRKRALSIAGWFRAHGLRTPIAYEGLGEAAPIVKSGDEVDEPKNRRVDYTLALEPPQWTTSGGFAWKAL